MSDKEIRQLRTKLAKMQIDAEAVCQILGIDWVNTPGYPDSATRAIGQLRAELTDACAARDALARECNQLEADREYNAALVLERDKELSQARDELAAVDEALGEFYCPVLDPETDEPCGSFWKDHGVNMIRQALDLARQDWAEAVDRCEEVEADLKLNAKMLADQCDQARQAENKREEARRIARKQHKELKDLRGANKFLMQDVKYMEDNRDYWYETCLSAERERDEARKEAQGQSNEAQERLAILDAAEAALANCGIGGIFAEFEGLADAVNQMAQHIKELASRLTRAQVALDDTEEMLQNERQLRQEAELAVHTHDKACGELAQIVHIERQLRQEAEQNAEILRLMIMGISKALDECEVGHYHYLDLDDEGINTRTRVLLLGQRAKRAEGLAQLVNEEMVLLLERLAEWANAQSYAIGHWATGDDQIDADAKIARNLAAKIREALNDSQT